jgi:hypothetical protein
MFIDYIEFIINFLDTKDIYHIHCIFPFINFKHYLLNKRLVCYKNKIYYICPNNNNDQSSLLYCPPKTEIVCNHTFFPTNNFEKYLNYSFKYPQYIYHYDDCISIKLNKLNINIRKFLKSNTFIHNILLITKNSFNSYSIQLNNHSILIPKLIFNLFKSNNKTYNICSFIFNYNNPIHTDQIYKFFINFPKKLNGHLIINYSNQFFTSKYKKLFYFYKYEYSLYKTNTYIIFKTKYPIIGIFLIIPNNYTFDKIILREKNNMNTFIIPLIIAIFLNIIL